MGMYDLLYSLTHWELDTGCSLLAPTVEFRGRMAPNILASNRLLLIKGMDTESLGV